MADLHSTENPKPVPEDLHTWLDALPLTDAQRSAYGYFIYIPTTHRVLLFERDSDEQFTFWCLKTNRLLHTFTMGTSDYVTAFCSVSGNWLVCMNEQDAGNSQWVTTYLHYIGDGFDAAKHLHVLGLNSLVSTTFEVGFDMHDNLWVDGMHVSLPEGKSEFIMEYYTLFSNYGTPEVQPVEPCPYGRMNTVGFEKYQIETSPIVLA